MPPAVMRQTVTLEGAEALTRVLDQLGPRIERKITRGAMTAAATPVVRAARKNARARAKSGDLARSAGKRVKTYTKNGVVFVAVGYLWQKGGFHSHLVEFGHRMVAGGSVRRLDGGLAPIEARGKWHAWVPIHGRHSTSRNKSKALMRYLAGVGPKDRLTKELLESDHLKRNLQQLLAEVGAQSAASAARPISALMRGAIASGGMRQEARGQRGHGRVTGRVPGYPILRPAWEATKQQCLQQIMSEHQGRVEKEAAALASEQNAV